MIDYPMAIMCQDVAATRHAWAASDREDAIYYYNVGHEIGWNNNLVSFKVWAMERAEYARRAMKAMGITDEDQYYA